MERIIWYTRLLLYSCPFNLVIIFSVNFSTMTFRIFCLQTQKWHLMSACNIYCSSGDFKNVSCDAVIKIYYVTKKVVTRLNHKFTFVTVNHIYTGVVPKSTPAWLLNRKSKKCYYILKSITLSHSYNPDSGTYHVVTPAFAITCQGTFLPGYPASCIPHRWAPRW